MGQQIKKIIGFVGFAFILSTLIWLGFWQIQRLEWKSNIIEKLDEEYAHNPKEQLFTFNTLKTLEDIEQPIKYGSVKGRYLGQHTIYLGPKTQDRVIGYHVITPLKMKSGIILINRGFTPQENGKIEKLEHSKGLTQVSGLIRKPDWNRFTPKNSPKNDIWIRLDIAQIAQAKNLQNVAPVMLYEGAEQWYPRNKHMQYTLFWFTLAVIWSGFGVYLGLLRKK